MKIKLKLKKPKFRLVLKKPKFKLKLKTPEEIDVNNLLVATQNREGFIPRKHLESLYVQTYSQLKEFIRRKVLVENRIDILANYVLEYDIAPHHDKMWKFLNTGEDGIDRKRALVLAPRGGGKTWMCTYAQVIFWILKDPNEKILITSDTQLQSEGFLRVIKGHLEDPLLVDIFGLQKGTKWDTREINVNKRTIKANESTVSCIGAGGGLTGKHYTKIVADDLVDEENSRTQHQRDMLWTWFYKTLYNATEDGFTLFVIGTLYHWDDLYCRLRKAEFKDNDLRIPALTQSVDAITEENPDGYISFWPSKFTIDALLKKRKNLGIHWYTQMQNEVDQEVGEYFNPAWISIEKKYPLDAQIWQGVDLAVSQKDSAAFFAHVTLAVTREKPKHYYLIDCIRTRLTSKRQTEVIDDRFKTFDPIRVGIEGNAYQAVKEQDVKERNADVRTKLVYSLKDKMSEALKFQPLVEEGRFHVIESTEWVRDLLATYPSKESLDVMDAIILAWKISRLRRKKKRREPGVI